MSVFDSIMATSAFKMLGNPVKVTWDNNRYEVGRFSGFGVDEDGAWIELGAVKMYVDTDSLEIERIL